ncbi:hypothetical protein [Ilumatobacter sp.]|uniref:hypothetical protein n=1 Tax=Ilumatobacter sp. TaxID=1967498 RepID=UPI003B51A659
MKRFLLTLATVFAIAVPTIATTPAQINASDPDEILSTEPVNVRVTPNLSGQIITQLDDGTPTNIRCAIAGQQIWDTNVWFYSDLANGERGFWTAYYSDADYNTSDDLSNRYGISRCERPSSTPGASVYYQPRFHLSDPLAPTSTYTAAKDYWAAGSCSAIASAGSWPAHFDGQLVTRASGWSLGRLGITYMLSHFPQRAANLDQIILFDPGNLDEYANNPCDARYDQDELMAQWLDADPSRRLLVLAGAWTRDVGNPDEEGRLHQGLQQHLFPAIRAAGRSHQVLICNYDTMGHAAVMENFGHLAGSGSLTQCPGESDAAWDPSGALIGDGSEPVDPIDMIIHRLRHVESIEDLDPSLFKSEVLQLIRWVRTGAYLDTKTEVFDDYGEYVPIDAETSVYYDVFGNIAYGILASRLGIERDIAQAGPLIPVLGGGWSEADFISVEIGFDINGDIDGDFSRLDRDLIVTYIKAYRAAYAGADRPMRVIDR